jgi:hypothetical protein
MSSSAEPGQFDLSPLADPPEQADAHPLTESRGENVMFGTVLAALPTLGLIVTAILHARERA